AFARNASAGTKTPVDDEVSDLTDSILNDEDQIGTSFVHAGGSVGGGGTAFGGGVDGVFTYNSGATGIARGARVNQRSDSLWAPNQLPEQDVKLDSTGSVTTVNLAGNLSILNILQNVGNGAEKGIGGFLSVNIHQNFATAYIDDLATVSAARDISLKTHG